MKRILIFSTIVIVNTVGPVFAKCPIIITNVHELQAMRDGLDDWYVLGCDIDASETQYWNEGAGFEPVGTDTNSFTGVFDGQGHVIVGLYINRPVTGTVGLFGYIENAEIKNIGLVDADVTALGGAGTLVGGSQYSKIFKAWATGHLKGTDSIQSPIGGLVGSSTYADSIVSQCYSSVTVQAISSGSPANRTGGLVGLNNRGSIIIDCYATGDVSGKYKVGGLVGDNTWPSYGGYVARCYSTGHVTGNGGGLIGYNYMGGETYDSYWDTETSGQTTSYGGTPKTTAEMKQQSTFTNWDFVDVWDIAEDTTYPFLRGAFEVYIYNYYVDDDGADDPVPGIPGASVGEPGLSDPCENGSYDHPFDSIQKAIDAADNCAKIIVLDGTYTGIGNYNIDPNGLEVTIKSENGPSNCTINCQSNGRAFIFQSGEYANTIIDGFKIKNGYSVNNGGAIFCDGSSPTIKNCTITNCYADESSGAAIWLQYNSNALISNCTISNNYSEVAGAIATYASSPTIKNCLMTDNAGYWSGALTSTDSNSNATIINCTIADNLAARGPGGLECYRAGNLTVINSILWDNVGGQIFEEQGAAYVTYSDVQVVDSNGLIVDSSWPGTGNINTDPLFAAPDMDDYHLKSSAGRWTHLLETNGDFNDDGIIDFLDLEIFTRYWLYSRLADLNNDGWVDFADHAILAANWLKTGTSVEGDINNDGIVNWLDLEIFARYWLQASLTAGQIVDLNGDKVVDFADYALFAANWLKPGSNAGGWTKDSRHLSPCIDAGDPASDYTLEPEPNGDRINMGAYGNTNQASKSPE